MNHDDETTPDDLLAAADEDPAEAPDTDDDPELADYYRDLADVNEAIANLYR